jgi:hypothetical protein
MRTRLSIVSAAALVVTTAAIHAQQKTPAVNAAERLSGTWTINKDLSPSFKASGRSGGRVGGARYAVGGSLAQRGRGNGPGPDSTPSAPGDLTPAERAELSAMQQIEQIAPTITIKATADSFSMVDPRGEQTCAITDKSAKLDTFGAKVTTKCRWNKVTLQQEFSTTRSKLTRSWSVDESGRLVVKMRTEGVNERAVEAAAVYDRSPS